MNDNKNIKLELTRKELEIIEAALSGFTGCVCHFGYGLDDEFHEAQRLSEQIRKLLYRGM